MIELPLDHNFPVRILDDISPWINEVKLIPIRRINAQLAGLADRKLLIALHQMGFRGIITNNYKMLQNPAELAAILKTKLSIFAIQGLGDDPVRATGALLLDLPPIVRALESGRQGIFWLRPRAPQPEDPWKIFRRAAERRHENAQDLYTHVKVSDDELSTPIIRPELPSTL